MWTRRRRGHAGAARRTPNRRFDPRGTGGFARATCVPPRGARFGAQRRPELHPAAPISGSTAQVVGSLGFAAGRGGRMWTRRRRGHAGAARQTPNRRFDPRGTGGFARATCVPPRGARIGAPAPTGAPSGRPDQRLYGSGRRVALVLPLVGAAGCGLAAGEDTRAPPGERRTVGSTRGAHLSSPERPAHPRGERGSARQRPDPRHSHTEQRWAAWGRTAEGRALAVVFTLRGEMIRPLSAWDMNRKERRRYEQVETEADS
jgi:hypothetical protein